MVPSKTNIERSSRQVGALLGLAVGDALGAAVEFKQPGSFDPVTDYRGGGPHHLRPGEWTDDTSMALALADSIAAVGWDLNDQARRYCEWWRQGKYSSTDRCFDIGLTIRESLRRFEETRDATRCATSDEQASGNGSLMRLAPVPIYFLDLFPDNISQLVFYAEQSSVPTHASAQCLSACGYFALVLAGLMSGLSRETVLDPGWEQLGELQRIKPLHPLIGEVAAGSFRKKSPPKIKGSGWVVQSLEAALWAFADTANFSEAVLRAVNLGDDADTTAAVCGQLAGAYWGTGNIPGEWLNKLARKEMLETACARLIEK